MAETIETMLRSARYHIPGKFRLGAEEGATMCYKLRQSLTSLESFNSCRTSFFKSPWQEQFAQTSPKNITSTLQRGLQETGEVHGGIRRHLDGNSQLDIGTKLDIHYLDISLTAQKLQPPYPQLMILSYVPEILETSSRLKTHRDQNLYGRSQVEEAENYTVKHPSHSWTWTFRKKVVQWPGKHSIPFYIPSSSCHPNSATKGLIRGEAVGLWHTNKTEETLPKTCVFLCKQTGQARILFPCNADKNQRSVIQT